MVRLLLDTFAYFEEGGFSGQPFEVSKTERCAFACPQFRDQGEYRYRLGATAAYTSDTDKYNLVLYSDYTTKWSFGYDLEDDTSLFQYCIPGFEWKASRSGDTMNYYESSRQLTWEDRDLKLDDFTDVEGYGRLSNTGDIVYYREGVIPSTGHASIDIYDPETGEYKETRRIDGHTGIGTGFNVSTIPDESGCETVAFNKPGDGYWTDGHNVGMCEDEYILTLDDDPYNPFEFRTGPWCRDILVFRSENIPAEVDSVGIVEHRVTSDDEKPSKDLVVRTGKLEYDHDTYGDLGDLWWHEEAIANREDDYKDTRQVLLLDTKSEYDPDVGDMRYSDFDEFIPGLYVPESYGPFYFTKDEYSDNEKTYIQEKIKWAKWGMLYLSDIEYEIRCDELIRRNLVEYDDEDEDDDKEEDKNKEDGSEEEDDDDTDQKEREKIIHKYTFDKEACNILLKETLFDKISQNIRNTTTIAPGGTDHSYIRQDAVIKIKGCSGFKYVVDESSYMKWISAYVKSGYPGYKDKILLETSCIMDYKDAMSDHTLVPRVKIVLTGKIPDDISGEFGGNPYEGKRFLAKIPAVSSNVLKGKGGKNTEYGVGWKYAVVAISGSSGKIKRSDLVYYEIIQELYPINGRFETEDGRFRVFGRPFRDKVKYRRSINEYYGSGTKGALLAVTGKKTYTNAAGGIYDIKNDKYYVLDATGSATITTKNQDGTMSSKSVSLGSSGYMIYDKYLPRLKLIYKKLIQSNRFSNMFFMPTLGLIKRMSLKVNESAEVAAELKSIPDRLYRLWLWCRFAESFLDGTYVAHVDKIVTFDDDGNKIETPGKYDSVGFVLRMEDRIPAFYGRVMNMSLLDEIGTRIVNIANSLLYKTEAETQKYSHEIGLHEGVRDYKYHLSVSEGKSAGTAKTPAFKKFLLDPDVVKRIGLGGGPYKSTRAAVDSIVSRINAMEEAADFCGTAVYVRRIPSVGWFSQGGVSSALGHKYAGTVDVTYHIKGLYTVPGCTAEMFYSSYTVQGLYSLDYHYFYGNSPLGCLDYCGQAGESCEDGDGTTIVLLTANCYFDHQDPSECVDVDIPYCIRADFDPSTGEGNCDDIMAARCAREVSEWLEDWQPRDAIKNSCNFVDFFDTDNNNAEYHQNPWIQNYVYGQSTDVQTAVFMNDDDTVELAVNLNTLDSEGYVNCEDHQAGAGGGGMTWYRYGDRQGALPFSSDGCGGYYIKEIHTENYDIKPAAPSISFYNVTEFLKLSMAEEYLKIPAGFTVERLQS